MMTAAQAAERIYQALDTLEDLDDVITQYHDKELDDLLLKLYEIAKEYEALDKRTSTCCQLDSIAA